MHARLAEVMDYVELKRAELLRSIAQVPLERMAIRASDEGWSVAEIIDHLELVETSIARVISKRAADARANGVGEERSTASVLRDLDHLEIEKGSVAMEAPSIVRPRAHVDASTAIAGLDTSRAALRAAALSASGLALGEIKQLHRTLGEIDLYQWILFLGQHEGRHTRQIERTLLAIKTDPVSISLDETGPT